MEKSNREVRNQEELLEIINDCKVCRLGMVDNGMPYVIPMNFGYTLVESTITIYLHCANKGQKVEALEKNNRVCIEMDQMKELITGENGCDYSCYYESFIGMGNAIFIDDASEKAKAFDAIMKHQTGQDHFTYNDVVMAKTVIIKIPLSYYSGKKHSAPS